MRKHILIVSLGFPLLAFALLGRVHASVWDNLWLTQNQQAQQLMDRHQFSEAAKRFEDGAWQATAAYRSGQYEASAEGYQALDTDEGYYNQGNALAHLGQYEKALKAYDHALRLNSRHEDAQYNRKIVEELLKQDKQKQKKENKDQDKQNQDKQNQDKQNQYKQNQDKQNQDKQNQDKQNQDKQNQDKQNQDKQNQDKQNQDKQNQDKQNQDKQNQDKQKANLSAAESEKQRAKEQWLRLIPDDPGGLMREKFMRDHLRRQRGWDQ
jgi:Ca-activated chloride channel family protein